MALIDPRAPLQGHPALGITPTGESIWVNHGLQSLPGGL
jgi:hypothetical protein